MGREDGHAILSSTCFQLGIAGAQITRSFSLLIQHTGLTHKQVGLLAVVDTGMASSQREIATQLGVAPSLVVSLVDQLASIGAVFMLLLDTVARSATQSEIPLSILTALVGAPFFIILLKRTGGGWK